MGCVRGYVLEEYSMVRVGLTKGSLSITANCLFFGFYLFIYLFFFFKFYFIFKLYIIVLVLPNIKMNLPQVYMCFSTFHNSVVFPLISLKRFSLKFSNQPWLISFHYLMCWAICCSDTFILYQMEVWNMIWEP